MYHNGLRYGRIAALVLFTHIVMLRCCFGETMKRFRI